MAITINGSGSAYVTPSTLTFPSSITWRRADWVLGDVLLISSASRILQSAAPALYSNLLVARLYILKPTISDGITSGVNCTLLHLSPSVSANASAIVVFPTPGISSMRTCPLARIAIIILQITSSLPTTLFFISINTFFAIFK